MELDQPEVSSGGDDVVAELLCDEGLAGARRAIEDKLTLALEEVKHLLQPLLWEKRGGCKGLVCWRKRLCCRCFAWNGDLARDARDQCDLVRIVGDLRDGEQRSHH